MASETGGIGRALLAVRNRAASTRDWVRKRIDPQRRHRALKLLCVVLATLLAIRALELLAGFDTIRSGWKWIAGGAFFGPIFFPDEADAPQWKDRVQAVLVLLGLPVLYLLWHWRDSNVRAQIAVSRDEYDNRRKDTNLKEFQEVQLRASGALPETLPAEAREQLQIAALHQLRGFLSGAYGEDFRRPAFELLLAGHAAAMERIGHLEEIEALLAGNPPVSERVTEIRKLVAEAKKQLTPVGRERLGILRDEAESIFGTGFDQSGVGYPLNGRRYDWIELPSTALLARRRLKGSAFVGADLSGAHLEGADLFEAHLEGADLFEAHLEGANLIEAHLEGANLIEAHLEGADLFGAHLEGAHLFEAHLEGATLIEARLEGANLRGAHLERARFDADTRLAENWDEITEFQRNAARREWSDRGAIFVDNRGDPTDLPPDDTPSAAPHIPG
ncbi:pentapeptide repeat-containing protein [Sphingosinithalassobacter portus]|uniref:pentapeptide repeat-containing protein n=1 Tax=Stakelama portus TaxID=2676234 RepID=UPI000D6DFFFD|nr:pentapeptide repeat-containing protein [Sphingosinithalassobacter portus]